VDNSAVYKNRLYNIKKRYKKRTLLPAAERVQLSYFSGALKVDFSSSIPKTSRRREGRRRAG
jgi:hypothetical protein